MLAPIDDMRRRRGEAAVRRNSTVFAADAKLFPRGRRRLRAGRLREFDISVGCGAGEIDEDVHFSQLRVTNVGHHAATSTR